MRIPVHAVLLALAVFSACARHDGSSPSVVVNNPPRFETRVEIATGTEQHSDYAVADFNGDNILDMALIGFDAQLRVLIGNGSGGFTPAQQLSLGANSNPIWIVAGDLDNDGDRDLAIARAGLAFGDVMVLRNSGLASFVQGPLLAVGNEPLAVVLGDANDDGRLDLVVSRPVSPQIVTWLSDGLGGFVQGPGIATLNDAVPYQMAVGDVSRDGIADLVACDAAGDRVLVYRGAGNSQSFLPTPTVFAVAGSPRAASIGDLSGDGFADIVVSAYTSNRFVVITNPQGDGTQRFEKLLAGAPSLCTIADVTNDAVPDLVACLATRASLSVTPGLAQGGLGNEFQLDASGLPLRPFVGDVDRNGRADVMALSGLGNRVNLWLAEAGTGRLTGARSYDAQVPSAGFLVGGDFDRDGSNEVAVSGDQSSFVSILGGDVASGLEVRRRIDVGLPVLNLEGADLDGDGDKDLMVAVYGGVKLMRNDAVAQSFDFTVLPAGGAVLAPGQGPFGVEAGQLNGDAFVDLVVADYQNGNISLLPGTATRFVFGTPIVLQLAGRPGDLALGDFTGDAVIDVAVSRVQFNDIAILQNDGTGNLVAVQFLPVQQAPNYLIANDFNRDGRMDLVASNSDSASITVLFSSGTGFTGANYPAGATPTALLGQDLTGDGIPDILVASLAGADFRVLSGDGLGGFPGLYPFPGTLGATDGVLQDMNADGFPELLISSQITMRLSQVRNLGF